MADKLKVMLVDDHYLVRMGLASIMALEPDVVVCAEASSGEQARAGLIRQVTAAVQWTKSIGALIDAGVTTFVEVGPGKVLARLGKRILKDCPVETPAEELAHA